MPKDPTLAQHVRANYRYAGFQATAMILDPF